ncbi:alpha/beta hydrolase [Planctomicrobium sp. SH668]|uniref:alpha/beta hydrolase n=1 Tax=Planctomicrobium sp. SH668 TaxID=3448126 RepID=UPI003F5C78C1
MMENSMSNYDALSDSGVDFRTRQFLHTLNTSGGKPMETLSPEAARQVLVGAQKSVSVKLRPATVTEKTIEQDGKRIGLVIVRPETASGTTPAFMYFHGGGWVLGDYPTHERLVRDIASYSGMTAVFVNYTPSPEAKYPVAIEEAYAATKWVSQHGSEINVDGARLAVVGNSVGGNMAAVVASMAKDRGDFQLKFQGLLWPVTNASFDTPSYEEFAEGRFLTRNMMKWMWDHYTTNPADRAQIYASPLRATVEQLKGLPPALIQTAGNDVLRDEAEEYARKLDSAEVDVTVTRYNNMIHDWGLLNPLADVPAVESALVQVAEELKRRLIKS